MIDDFAVDRLDVLGENVTLFGHQMKLIRPYSRPITLFTGDIAWAGHGDSRWINLFNHHTRISESSNFQTSINRRLVLDCFRKSVIRMNNKCDFLMFEILMFQTVFYLVPALRGFRCSSAETLISRPEIKFRAEEHQSKYPKWISL